MVKRMSAECVSIILFLHLIAMTTLFIHLHFEDGRKYLQSSNTSVSAFLQFLSRKTRTEDVMEDVDMELTRGGEDAMGVNGNEEEILNYTGNDQQVIRKTTENSGSISIDGLPADGIQQVEGAEAELVQPFEQIDGIGQELTAEAAAAAAALSEDAAVAPQEAAAPQEADVAPQDAAAAPEGAGAAQENAVDIFLEGMQQQTEDENLQEQEYALTDNGQSLPILHKNVPELDNLLNQNLAPSENNIGMDQQQQPEGNEPSVFVKRAIPDMISNDLQRTLPTLYEHYSDSAVVSGLTYKNTTFYLNNKEIRIMGGSIHYFRVHYRYWRDSLKKLRAAGLNTVTTYVPWNVHEQFRGHYWFSFYQHNLRKFMLMAKEEDLFVILRPGPYICAEWEFGGFPSWLLHDRNLQLRTLNSSFILPAKKFLRQIVKLVSDLQWSSEHGAQPLIAVQIENEFPITTENAIEGKKYLKVLKNSMEEDGMTHVLYVVSNPSKYATSKSMIPGVLQAVNFGNLPYQRLKHLRTIQPDAPLFVMEFWTGWFDTWLKNHHFTNLSVFAEDLETLLRNDVSFNLYMFHGGTTFGFMNGAALKRDGVSRAPVVSSYDFNAPITEGGDYTAKYHIIKNLLQTYVKGQPLHNPPMPLQTPKQAYPVGVVKQYIPFETIVQRIPVVINSENPVNMEDLKINSGAGQSYGYILYRKTSVKISALSILKIQGLIRDILYVMVDGTHVIKPLTARNHSESHMYLKDHVFLINGDDGLHQLDLLVENMGRLSVGAMNNERKGILGQVYLDQQLLTNWTTYPLELTHTFIQRLSGWKVFTAKEEINSPCLYRAVLQVKDEQPSDTYLMLPSSESLWLKGQIFINNFNLGRYWHLGPSRESYIPAPILRTGDNMVVVFELYRGGRYIYFQDHASTR